MVKQCLVMSLGAFLVSFVVKLSSRSFRLFAQMLLLLCFGVTSVSVTQAAVPDDSLEVSYIYSAVLGTGTYTIKGRRLTMFRIPFSWTQRKPTEDTAGWKWLLPVVIGYDDLSKVESDLVAALLPDQLVTLTFLPGIEYLYPVTPDWHIKPFVQAGLGRDFSSNETIYMSQLGVRSLSLFELSEKWDLRWGITVRGATEYQEESKDRINLGIFETGLDIRRDLPVRAFDRAVDMGTYYVFQHFIPEWTTTSSPDFKAESLNLHEIGLSVGLKQPRKVLGIEVQRVRLGYKSGGNFRGWTIGTEFPF